MSVPRVAVIIPLFNLGRYVAETIESALAQTLSPEALEILVIDDGSTDDGGEVARRYAPRVRVVRQENRGLSAARNAGIRLTVAPFLTFLDADDRILPGKLAAQLALFEARPDVDVVYSGYSFIDEAGAPLPTRGWPTQEGDLLPRLLLGNLVHPHAVVVRRTQVEDAGGFDETLTSVEDWDLWLRISRRGARWACVDAPLAEYRIRGDAMHQNPARMAANAHRVLERFFADETLPASLRALEPQAWEHAYLTAASDHYRAGDAGSGARWFREAARVRPSLVTEPRTLARFCRWLLPPEVQSERATVAERQRLLRQLRTALRDLFGAPDAAPEVVRLRWRAELAYWRTAARLARKGVRAAFA